MATMATRGRRWTATCPWPVAASAASGAGADARAGRQQRVALVDVAARPPDVGAGGHRQVDRDAARAAP